MLVVCLGTHTSFCRHQVLEVCQNSSFLTTHVLIEQSNIEFHDWVKVHLTKQLFYLSWVHKRHSKNTSHKKHVEIVNTRWTQIEISGVLMSTFKVKSSKHNHMQNIELPMVISPSQWMRYIDITNSTNIELFGTQNIPLNPPTYKFDPSKFTIDSTQRSRTKLAHIHVFQTNSGCKET